MSLALILALPAVAGAAPSALPAPTPAPAPAPSSGRAAGPPDGFIPPPAIQPRATPFPTTPSAPAPVTTAPQPIVQPLPVRETARAAPGRAPAPRQRGGAVPPPAAGAPEAPVPLAPAAPAAALEDAPSLPTPEPAGTMTSPFDNPSSGWPDWLPLATLGAVALAVLLAALGWRRRRKRDAQVDETAPAMAPATSAPAAPPTPAPAPEPQARTVPAKVGAQAGMGRRAQLSISLEPVSAMSTLVNFRLRYAVHISNSGTVDASDVTIRVGLFAGTQASEGGVARWLALDGQAPHHQAPVVAADGDLRIEGELAASLDALGAMDVEGRQLAIALVAIDCRYHNAPGAPVLDGQAARAFVIGREPQQGAGDGDAAQPGKLRPFRIDQGPMSYAPLGWRDTGIALSN